MALGLVVKQEWSRSLAAEVLVRHHGLVSQQPVGQLPVQGGQVVKEPILVGGHEGFWEGALEPFGVGVRVRGTRIRPPVSDAVIVEALREGAQALRAVVGEKDPGWSGP